MSGHQCGEAVTAKEMQFAASRRETRRMYLYNDLYSLVNFNMRYTVTRIMSSLFCVSVRVLSSMSVVTVLITSRIRTYNVGRSVRQVGEHCLYHIPVNINLMRYPANVVAKRLVRAPYPEILEGIVEGYSNLNIPVFELGGGGGRSLGR
jgi:hypothetical protein